MGRNKTKLSCFFATCVLTADVVKTRQFCLVCVGSVNKLLQLVGLVKPTVFDHRLSTGHPEQWWQNTFDKYLEQAYNTLTSDHYHWLKTDNFSLDEESNSCQLRSACHPATVCTADCGLCHWVTQTEINLWVMSHYVKCWAVQVDDTELCHSVLYNRYRSL